MHDLALIAGVFPSVWLLSPDEAMRQGPPEELLQPEIIQRAFRCLPHHRYMLIERTRSRMDLVL
jgi:ABC-type cobalamin/Fe3+-siderophores transport system ATPase subunit